ncbi:MAG TPA: hypothetical protein VFM18_22250 [Methanosarcina sp.]|nr:hypothetical protein [Methanosarcina sp.]
MLTVKGNLFNQFFTDTITVYSRAYSINGYGENSLTETSRTLTASVQPTAGKELQFLPDFALETETITIYSLEMLNTESNGSYSDIIGYNGNRYQVIKSKKWKTHCEAVAMLEGLSE